MKMFHRFAALFLALLLTLTCVVPALAEDDPAEQKTLRIIGTSDLHGKLMPWDYALNDESTSGSVAQLSSAIAQYRDDNTLLETDVHGEIGGVRELIRDYIINVKGGTIAPECDDNWKITGSDWDEALHRKAVEMPASGKLTIPFSEDGRTPNIKAIMEEDVK